MLCLYAEGEWCCVCFQLMIVGRGGKMWGTLTEARERKRRRGAEASTSRPWRYSQIMAFLNPFMEDRATSSYFPASQRQGDAGDTGEDAATTSQISSEADREVYLYSLLGIHAPWVWSPITHIHTHVHIHTLPYSTSTSRERSTPWGPKRPHEESLSPFERQPMGAVVKVVTQTAPPDPDRQFFEGLLPDLKALSARGRADVTFNIK